MTEFSPTTRFIRNKEIICGDVDGELIALKIDTGSYLNLNATASRVLKLFEESAAPLTLLDICTALRKEYRVSEEKCLDDVHVLLRRCLDLGLLQLAGTD